MDYEKLNRVELSRLLVAKHENFIEEYGKEFELLQRAYVLKEKRDQLEYWLDESKDDPKKNLEYKKAAELAENELTQVNEEIKALYDKPRRNFGPAPGERPARFKWLSEQLALHNESRDYWSNKILELEEKEKKAKEDAAAEKKKSKEKPKDKEKKETKQKSKSKKTVKGSKTIKTKKTAKSKTKDEESSTGVKAPKKSTKAKTTSGDAKKTVKEKEKKTAKKTPAKKPE